MVSEVKKEKIKEAVGEYTMVKNDDSTEKDKKHALRLVLEEEQHEALRELAFKMRTTKTALIREAINNFMLSVNNNETSDIEFKDE